MAFEVLLARFPRLRLQLMEPVWRPHSVFCNLHKLPVVLVWSCSSVPLHPHSLQEESNMFLEKGRYGKEYALLLIRKRIFF